MRKPLLVRRNPVRSAVRLLGFLAICGGAAADGALGAMRGRDWTARDRALWLRRWARWMAWLVGLDVRVRGEVPEGGGMWVSNHLGYLDIVAIAAVAPVAFVSKADVRRWPVVGLLTWIGGTIYLRRESRMDVGRLEEAFERVTGEGVPVVFFPEGTSSGGRDVLKFHSSLFGPAVARGWGVTPLALCYELDEGSVEDEVAYWRDMVFVPHLLRLFAIPRIRVEVRFGEAVRPDGDRKALATGLRERVGSLLRGEE